MAKEWVLNSVVNRFQLNFKRNVGAVSEAIRNCAPKTLGEWQAYYFANVREKNHIKSLGQKLYIKITEVIVSEVENITEKDCVDYMFNLVINRTYDGYHTEIETIYGQLAEQLDCNIEAAPDEWDRGYNVDFFIKVNERFIGLQIKPISDVSHISRIYTERDLQKATHAKFKDKFGGNVFYVFSKKENDNKKIHNTEVLEEIRAEINRLSKF